MVKNYFPIKTAMLRIFHPNPVFITLLPFFAMMRSHFLVFCKSCFQLLFQFAPLKSSYTRAQVHLSAGLLISHAQQCRAVLSYSFYRHGKWRLKETVLIPTSPSNVIPILPFYSFTLGKLFQGHHSSPCSIFLNWEDETTQPLWFHLLFWHPLEETGLLSWWVFVAVIEVTGRKLGWKLASGGRNSNPLFSTVPGHPQFIWNKKRFNYLHVFPYAHLWNVLMFFNEEWYLHIQIITTGYGEACEWVPNKLHALEGYTFLKIRNRWSSGEWNPLHP